MTARRRLKENGIKGRLIVILFVFLSLKSCVVKGNAMTCYNQECSYEADRSHGTEEVFDRTQIMDSASINVGIGFVKIDRRCK